MLAGNIIKVLQEIFYTISCFQIIKEVFYRNTGTSKDRSATKNFRIRNNDTFKLQNEIKTTIFMLFQSFAWRHIYPYYF